MPSSAPSRGKNREKAYADPAVQLSRVTLTGYAPGVFSEQTYRHVSWPAPPTERVTWVNVEGAGDVTLLQGLADRYGIHPLVLEDITSTDQRPKTEDYGSYLFIVLKMFRYEEAQRVVLMDQVSIILGSDFVISFVERGIGDPFGALRERIRSDRGLIRAQKADFLAYSLVDAVVDNYFLILERFADRVEELQDEIVLAPDRDALHEMHALKREMLFLRKAVWPLREVIGSLERRESPLILPGTVVYLRDLYDHTIQVIDMIETYRDMLAGMLDIYLSSVANRTNEVMKVLTVIATIFMPVTFIASIYGMNFRNMPELESPWGYPAVLALMAAVVAGMVIYFRRKGWF